MKNLPENKALTFVPLNDPPLSLESDRVKTHNWIKEKDRLEDICHWISNGGSLIDLCKNLSIQYSPVMKWINKEDQRRKEYEIALKDRNEWMVQELTNELKKICSVDVRKVFDESGNLLPPHSMPEDVVKALGAFELDDNGKVKVRFLDKLRAIEVLGKNLKMFVDRVEHTGTLTLEKMIEGSLPDDTSSEKN